MCDTSNGYFFAPKIVHCFVRRLDTVFSMMENYLQRLSASAFYLQWFHHTTRGGGARTGRGSPTQLLQQTSSCRSTTSATARLLWPDSGSSRIALNNWSNHRHSLNISVSINRAGWDVQLCTTPDLTGCNCKQGKFNMDQKNATNPPITKWSTGCPKKNVP